MTIALLDINTLTFILWFLLVVLWYISENDLLSIGYSLLLISLSLILITDILPSLQIGNWILSFIIIAIPILFSAHSLDSYKKSKQEGDK